MKIPCQKPGQTEARFTSYYTTRLWSWPIRVMKPYIEGLGAIKRATKQYTEKMLFPGFPYRGLTGIRRSQDIYDIYVTMMSFWKGLEPFDNDQITD